MTEGTTMRHKSDVIAGRTLTAVAGWALVLVFALTGSARAEDYRGTEEQRMACTGDVMRLCFSEIPNVGRIVSCLQREKQQLSSGCRAVFDHYSNVRVAYERWQHRHPHLASSRIPPEQPSLRPAEAERRNEIAPVASVEPVATGSVATANDHRTPSAHKAQHHGSDVAFNRAHKGTKIALLHHLHGKHPTGHHRFGAAPRHRYAMVAGKAYRHHYYRDHRG
jgi:hypothetical protein